MLSLTAISLASIAIGTVLPPNLLTNSLTQVNIEALVLLQYVLYCLVGLRFMSWLYVFIEATQDHSDSSHDISPRWAYLGFGTPWLNLFLPYRIVLKLSKNFGDQDHSDRRKNIQIIVTAWWSLHIAYFFLAPITLLLFHYQGYVDVINFADIYKVILFVLNSLLVLGVCRCARTLVSHLERERQRQQEWAKNE
ncbi:MAG: DUF4328 domain-containing protein [Halioglobus sp.]|nr:DUF4328 domain-containing protein [Halioglobus sp.]